MKMITHAELRYKCFNRFECIDGCRFVILRGDGSLYDAYASRGTAYRVLSDLANRYEDAEYEVVEVVDG